MRGRCLRERVGRGGLPGGASRVAHWAERGCDWAGGVLAFTIKEEEWMEAWVVVETVRDWKHTEQMGVPRMLRVYCARGCVNRHRGVVDISPCVPVFYCFRTRTNHSLRFLVSKYEPSMGHRISKNRISNVRNFRQLPTKFF